MRVAFVHDWKPDIEQELTWQDGLAAAVRELMNRGHEIQIYTCGSDMLMKHPYFPIQFTTGMRSSVKAFKPDVILHWADFTRPNAKILKSLGIPMAICFAGGDIKGENNTLFDHIFVESEIYKQGLNENGFDNVSIAFGTNTDLFTPVSNPKLFDTIFPATFAEWKRHNLYAAASEGLRSLACGYMYQTREKECWEDCIKHGVTVLPHVSAQTLHWLYAASKVVVVPSRSDGGSQRTVLEAMAMNLPVIVTDSDKFDFAGERVYHCQPDANEIRSYINVLLDGEPDINTREYVVNNWSEKIYADSLEKELLRLNRK